MEAYKKIDKRSDYEEEFVFLDLHDINFVQIFLQIQNQFMWCYYCVI